MKHDLAKKIPTARHLSRREMLGYMSATAAAVLVGCECRQNDFTNATSVSPQTGAKTGSRGIPSCVVRPEQTEGPYFVDERLNRSDIRSDPSDDSVKDGIPLQLLIRVSQISGSGCTSLAGAMVDLWQCDALGVYSDVRDRSFDTNGKKFLRGYQVTDNNGSAEFITIYPGWYPGRTVHIHFKIRAAASKRAYEFTSQLYFEESITDEVHLQAPYVSRGRRTTLNTMDGIFRRGGQQLILQVVRQAQAYAGAFDIGLQTA
ncbi:MAG: intradiol ring-cleavage dioxygenase [Nitrospirota bacterium]